MVSLINQLLFILGKDTKLINELQKQIEELKANNTNDQNHEEVSCTNDSEGQMMSLNQQIAELKKKLEDANAEIKTLCEEIKLSEQDLNEADDDIDGAQKDIQELQATNDKIMKDLNDEFEENNYLLTKIGEMVKNRDELLFSVDSSIEQTKFAFVDLDKKVETDEAQLGYNLEAYIAHCNELGMESSDLRNKLETLHEELKEIQEAMEKNKQNRVKFDKGQPDDKEMEKKIEEDKKAKEVKKEETTGENENMKKKAEENTEKRNKKKEDRKCKVMKRLNSFHWFKP